MSYFVDALGNDIRFALRVLRRSPWENATLIGVLVVALGIAVTILAAVRGVLLRPLPFADPDGLVSLSLRSETGAGHAGLSVAEFLDWRAVARSFSDIAAYRVWGFELDGAAEPERVAGARVTPNMFGMIGASIIAGRPLVESDLTANVVVLSDSLWRTAFASDPSAVGKTIRLNGQPYRIVGVAAAAAMYPAAALWVPYVFASYEREQRGDRALTVLARMRDGVSIERARTDATGIMHVAAQRYPATSRGWMPEIVPLRDVVIGNAAYALKLLLIATLGLLAVGCANVGNALIARLLDRRHELATRAAVGASVARLVQQVVTEAVVLGTFGGAGAFLLALAGTRWLATLGPEYLPRGGDVKFDGLMVILAGFVMIAVAAVLALLVTLSLRRLQLGAPLRSRVVRSRDRSHKLRDAFAVGQLALSVILLADGLLLTMSMRELQAVDLGFDPRGVASVAVSLPYPSAERRVAFVDELLALLASASRIRGAAVTSRVPFTASATGGVVNTVESPGESSPPPRAAVTVVSTEYFGALRIAQRAGRLFSPQDRPDAPRVAVVDEELARQLRSDRSAVGKHVRLGGGTGADTATIEIIGVVASVRSVDPATTSAPTIYLPYAQTAWPSMSVVATSDERSTADVLRAVRRAIQSIDPRRPVYNSRIIQRSLDAALATRRLQTLLLVGFAGAALIIALLGVHALFSHSVGQRHREFGIRFAAGAAPEDVVRLVLREAFVRVIIGVALGIILALAFGGMLRNALFGVTQWNITAITGAVALPAVGAVLASYLPARRAAQVSPMVVLRADGGHALD